MSSKRLIINMVSNIVSFIVSMGISFLLTPFIINTVGREAYGFVGLANNFVSYAELITLALNAVASRFITVKIHENKEDEANKYFTSVTIANIITSLVLLIPAIIVVIYMDSIINIPLNILKDIQVLWALIFLNFLIGIITSTYNVITFATNRLELSAIRSIQSNMLRVVILIILFSLLKPKVWYLGVAAIICTIFIFITNIKYKKLLLPQLKVKYQYFSISIIKELLCSGIWSVVTKLGQILSDGLDLLITNLFISASSMGMLSIAKIVPTAISSLLITVSGVFSPQITIYYAQKNIEKLVEEIKKSMKISGIFTSIAMSCLIVLGYSFYSLWVPGEDIRLIQILSIITALNILVSGVINTLFSVFTIVNKLKINSCVILIQGVINALIVFILLKTTDLGVFAVAGVSSITAIVRNLTFVPIYAAVCLKVPINTFYSTILKYIFSTIIIIFGNYIACYSIDKSSWIGLIFSGIVCVIIGAILSYLILFNKYEKKALNDRILLKLKLKNYIWLKGN